MNVHRVGYGYEIDPSFIAGKRDAYHAKAFIADLASRVSNHIQVSCDFLKAYADAMNGVSAARWIMARFQKPTHSVSLTMCLQISLTARQKS